MKLSTYLKQENETAADFARSVNASRSAICRLIAGTRVPSIDLAQRIRKATFGHVGLDDWQTKKKGPYVRDSVD